MPKYLITWDVGYGESHEVWEAKDAEAALGMAADAAHEEAASNMSYDAKPMTQELADEYGLDFGEDE